MYVKIYITLVINTYVSGRVDDTMHGALNALPDTTIHFKRTADTE